MAQKTDVTVYIGRFNPFHNGHAYVLKKALETSKLVIVLVGSSGQARSLKNPFTFDERHDMIQKWYIDTGLSWNSGAKLLVLPIRDYPYNDALWIRQVQRTVKKAVSDFCIKNDMLLTTLSLTGSDRDESTWYLNAFPQWKQDLVETYALDSESISATRVREWLFGKDISLEDVGKLNKMIPKTTLRYLHEFSESSDYAQLSAEHAFVEKYKAGWSSAPYAPTFVTVDAVVVQSGHVLAVRRGAEPGKGLWALPGGFVNQQEKLRAAAIRELVEETGIRLAEGKKAKELTEQILNGSIRESETFDKPDRDLRGRTITTAFLFRLDDTKPLPKVKGMDDAADAFWIPINDALERTDKWYADHHAILETMIAYKDI
jgi:bifunctional NMN adenylyltransferase/nudix hydrolase